MAIGVVAAGSAAAAQSLTASAVMIDARHDLLDGDLFGASVDVRLPIRRGATIARLGVERLVGDSRRVAVPCSGLIEPGTCPPEPVSDDAQFAALSAGVANRLVRWRRIGVDLGANLRFGVVDVETRGRTSGRALSADRWLWGLDLALDATWTPWADRPLGIELGVAAGGLKPVMRDRTVDAYTPFNGDFGATRLRIGLSWRTDPDEPA